MVNTVTTSTVCLCTVNLTNVYFNIFSDLKPLHLKMYAKVDYLNLLITHLNQNLCFN